jgi:signal transduction histidine kinase/DNA-binding response OmpR family regulator
LKEIDGAAVDKPRVLVVDDEESIRHVLHRVLEMNGCEIREAASAEDAITQLDDWEPEVALLDIVLPGKNGIQLLTEIKQQYADTEVLMMTSNSSADTALQAIRRGAHDYLQKPFDDLKEIWTNVQRALEKRNLALTNRDLLQKQEERTKELSSTVALSNTNDGICDFSSLQGILDNFLAVVMHELDVERASLMMLNKKTNELEILASKGIPLQARGQRVPLGEGIAGKVAQSGETFLVTDAATDNRVKAERPDMSNSFISAPIVFAVAIKSQREVFGVINVTNRRSGKPFNSDDVAFLSGLASQLGIVIDGARRSDQLHKAYQSLRATQEQLVFSERIKAVGQMAAGVAHDFNNALSVIVARAQFALARLEGPGPDIPTVRSDLETIIKTSLQGAESIKRIQDYTRIRKDTPNSPVSLNSVIKDAVEIARPKWKEQSEARGKQVVLETNLQEIPDVSGNVYELTQVVNNLIFNAVEAMPDGGRIQIDTSTRDGLVMMRLADTGIGMNDETQKRLFEPFFTTKESGQGLGTSIVFGIVSRHGGEITVDSVPGKGTTFTVTLPECRFVQTDIDVDRAIESRPFVAARILLIDDDDMVRDTHEEVLKAGGHRVATVGSGMAAVEKCHEQEFDVVITDLSMPGMSGLELATEVKRLHPKVPVVLFSGWAMQELEEKVKEAGIDHILVKPCLMEDLLGVVQRAVHTAVQT